MPQVVSAGNPASDRKNDIRVPGGFRSHTGCEVDRGDGVMSETTGLLESIKNNEQPNTTLGKTVIGVILVGFLAYAVFYG